MLLFNHTAERVVQGQISRQRKDIRPRHHYLAHGDVFQLQRVVDHFLLKWRNLPELPAGSHDQL